MTEVLCQPLKLDRGVGSSKHNPSGSSGAFCRIAKMRDKDLLGCQEGSQARTGKKVYGEIVQAGKKGQVAQLALEVPDIQE